MSPPSLVHARRHSLAQSRFGHGLGLDSSRSRSHYRARFAALQRLHSHCRPVFLAHSSTQIHMTSAKAASPFRHECRRRRSNTQRSKSRYLSFGPTQHYKLERRHHLRSVWQPPRLLRIGRENSKMQRREHGECRLSVDLDNRPRPNLLCPHRRSSATS